MPAGLVGGLAIAGFVVAILAAAITPVLSRLDRLEAWRGPLKLVPYALLLVGAILAGAAAVLGSVSAERPGVREVASVALAILCLTPLIGASAVRLSYGAPGKRTFQQQIAANRGSSCSSSPSCSSSWLSPGSHRRAVGSRSAPSLPGAGGPAVSILVTLGATGFDGLRRRHGPGPSRK
jgi:hypothetical protein